MALAPWQAGDLEPPIGTMDRCMDSRGPQKNAPNKPSTLSFPRSAVFRDLRRVEDLKTEASGLQLRLLQLLSEIMG